MGIESQPGAGTESVERAKQKVRIMVMLGSRMIHTNDIEEWKFPFVVDNKTNTTSTLPVEVSGGFSRMRAVYGEYERSEEEHEKTKVLVAGGREDTGESKADEAARQLVERYGLPAEDVISIGAVGSKNIAGGTLSNAAATCKYIEEHHEELGDISSIDVVTNNFHMLRAWMLFSQGMLKHTANEDFMVSPEDITAIEDLLEKNSPHNEDWTEDSIKETRDQVMAILKPYFENSTISINPVVVEESLESDPEDHAPEARYARMLRNNSWVRETLQFEYKGVIDLLKKQYK